MAIYRANYWDAARCDELPEAVREIHFDAAVNSGVTRANKLLQAAAGVDEDGVIGNRTLAAVAEMDGRLLKARYLAARYRFYGSIIQRDRSQLVFIAGWMARMAEFN
jgi:lysozyme family protein